MADVKIANLVELLTPTNSDIIIIEDVSDLTQLVLQELV